MAPVRSVAAATPDERHPSPTSGRPPRPTQALPSAHAERDAETAELFAALADAPDGRSRAVALERIVLLYLDLCGSMAARYDGRGIEHDDLVQVARLALVKAIDRYVPGQGPSFAAFAVPTISGELKRHFRDRGWMVRPPRRLQEMRVQVQSCRNRLEQEVGHTPSDAEVAHELGVTRAAVKEAVAASSSFHPTSLDAGTTDDESGWRSPTCSAHDDESLARVEDRVCLARRPLRARRGRAAAARAALRRRADPARDRRAARDEPDAGVAGAAPARRAPAVALADDATAGRERLEPRLLRRDLAAAVGLLQAGGWWLAARTGAVPVGRRAAPPNPRCWSRTVPT